MRDQYAGDLSDVLKFALLRALAQSDRRLGIAWYFASGQDGEFNGQHLEWRDEQAWQIIDAGLHAGLASLPERSIAALERADIWPSGVMFHREPVPARAGRNQWALAKRDALKDANLVFLDPDNGVGTESIRHATLAEIRQLRRSGRSIVFITFPGRNTTHDVQVQTLHRKLFDEAEAAHVLTLCTNVSVPLANNPRSFVQRARWFTVVDPDFELAARARAFATSLGSVPRLTVKLDESALSLP